MLLTGGVVAARCARIAGIEAAAVSATLLGSDAVIATLLTTTSRNLTAQTFNDA